jgi:hypothetical protein
MVLVSSASTEVFVPNNKPMANQANLKTTSLLRPKKLEMETAVALAGTAFAAILLVLTAMHAGPLWRDEVNSLNVAQMPSLKELWGNMSFESFPPLWPLLLRAWDFLGMASDAGIRVLGLYVGLFFLASLWLCSRWIGGRAPTLSVALLGSLPVFIFIVGANRAYGLASCLLVLSFGMIWRMIEFPSRSRILWTGLICVLFAHCVYYDAVFLVAMLSGAAVVVIRRRQWKTLGALMGIGTVAGASMAIYLPIIHRGSAYVRMNQEPSFNSLILWYKFGDAVTAKSSAHPSSYDGPEVWLWVAFLLGGSVVTFMMQRKYKQQTHNQGTATVDAVQVRTDLALFCFVSMFLGMAGFMAFLVRLQYVTQAWYYVEMLCLCAISIDGLLGAIWPTLRPWGLLRIGFIVVMMTWCARSAWEEAHTRRSNVDLLAAVLNQKAEAGDLIVVQSSWEGITFNRYYTGRAHWVTVPPMTSHKVHRNDLATEQMNQRDPMAPVLREITDTLRNSNSVWTVGSLADMRPKQLLPPSGLPVNQWGPHLKYWNAQITEHLQHHASQEQVLEISVDGPVNRLENLPVRRFSGYKPDTN